MKYLSHADHLDKGRPLHGKDQNKVSGRKQTSSESLVSDPKSALLRE